MTRELNLFREGPVSAKLCGACLESREARAEHVYRFEVSLSCIMSYGLTCTTK